MNKHEQNSLVVWRLLDGKPGHEKQSLGLVDAMRKQTTVDCYDINVSPNLFTWVNYVASIWPQGQRLPLPDFIIGAGQQTHIDLLAAKKAFGGQTVVLMRPSVSASLYDFALIPEHDRYQGYGNVIETRGVLNPMQADGEHDPNRVLLLIGGPSKHYGWDNQQVINQVKNLVAQQPEKRFILSTSRRTPPEFLAALQKVTLSQLTIFDVDQTPKGWVERQLSLAGTAWITEDSVSMVYEALTAQVAVGLMHVNKLKENRVANGVAALINKHMVVQFDEKAAYKRSMRALVGFKEADRCANQILNNWAQSGRLLPQPQTTKIA